MILAFLAKKINKKNDDEAKIGVDKNVKYDFEL